MNYNRMTIRETENGYEVFKMTRRQLGGYATDMENKRFTWNVPAIAKPRFKGSYNECMTFIASSGAEFMTEHGIPC